MMIGQHHALSLLYVIFIPHRARLVFALWPIACLPLAASGKGGGALAGKLVRCRSLLLKTRATT